MTDKEFVQMIVSERINVLLGRKLTSKESEILDRGEEVIKGLSEEQRAGLEEYMNQMVRIEAAAEEKAYLGGVRDRICLVLDIYETWRTENGRQPKSSGKC